MPTVLDDIVENKRREVSERKALRPVETLRPKVILRPKFAFEQALKSKADAVKLILEVKPASPSAGVLVESLDLNGLLGVYNEFATCISVLTDETYFRGSLDLLRQVKQQSPRPVLCKDFIIDPYQLVEAQHAGADAVLLIVKILEDNMLAELHRQALAFGLTPVVEVQSETELARALAVNPKVILVNNRNLENFTIDLDTSLRLIPQIPGGIIPISASGIESAEDIERLLPVVSNFLIGSAVMRTPLAHLPEKLEALTRVCQG